MTTWTPLDEYATNLITYSEDFSQWQQIVGGEVISNSSEGPFGLLNATLVKDNSDSSYSQIRYAIGEVKSSSHCFSLFIKKDTTESRVVAIRVLYVDGETTPSSTLRLNTYTGEIENRSAETITTVNYGCDDYTTYWRVWVAVKSNLLCTHLVFFPAIAESILVLPSDTAIGEAVIFGAQFEQGDDPSGYIKTDGAEVTIEKQTEWARV